MREWNIESMATLNIRVLQGRVVGGCSFMMVISPSEKHAGMLRMDLCQNYLMKLIRNRGTCPAQIYTVFRAWVMSRLMWLSLPGEVLCQSSRPIVLMLYSNDATDMDTLIRFTVWQTCLTQLTWILLIKCNLRLTVCIHCSPSQKSTRTFTQ